MSRASSIAVIGAGVAGLSAARLLARSRDVTVLEAEPEPGGHASAATVPAGGGAAPADIGFQLFHERHNPNLRALLASLGVATEPVPFTISVTSGADAWTNNGARTPFGDRMAAEMARLLRAGPMLARQPPSVTLRDVLPAAGLSADFLHKVLAPLLSFWWVSRAALLDMPAFAVGSGLLQGAFPFLGPVTFHRPRDGALEYARRLAAPIADRLALSTSALKVERRRDRVIVHDARGRALSFGNVLLAVDAAAALELLDEPTPDERALLGAARFETATLVAHTDERVMPADRALWSYGNYRDHGLSGEPGTLTGEMTYWAPRGDAQNVFVTVVAADTAIASGAIVARRAWRHLVVDAAAAERSLAPLQGRRGTWFAGGHSVGYPVHEHALCSGLAVAEALGEPYPFAGDGEARRAYEAFRGRAISARRARSR